MNQGIHCIDLLQWFLGPVKSVYAITDTVAHKGIEVEDIAVAVIRFKNGAQGVIEGSTSCFPGLPKVLQIYGTLGTITLREEQITDWQFINPTREDLDFSKQIINQKQAEAGETDSTNPCASLSNFHEYQIKDMIRAINDDVALEITGEEARKSVEIILAIYKSARLREEVTLPLS
jgi:predicted dehydrogenase